MAAKGNAFLTGAAGGMGTAIARALLAGGYRVILADRDEEKLKPLAAELGDAATSLILDVTDPDRTAPRASSNWCRPASSRSTC